MLCPRFYPALLETTCSSDAASVMVMRLLCVLVSSLGIVVIAQRKRKIRLGGFSLSWAVNLWVFVGSTVLAKLLLQHSSGGTTRMGTKQMISRRLTVASIRRC